MVYCVQLRAAFSSSSRRDAVLADIQTRIASKPRWGVTLVEPRTWRFGVNGLIAEARFSARADADDLNARIRSFATGQRTPLTGSSLILHDCTHDGPTNACTVVARTDW